jgi:hypothetical protein
MDSGIAKAVRSNNREPNLFRRPTRAASANRSGEVKVKVMSGPFRLPAGRGYRVFARALAKLPRLEGRPVDVSLRPELTVHRGQLLSRSPRGKAVHAGADIKKRFMVLDTTLTRNSSELERIFIHEVYHFVWARLSNAKRWSYEELVAGQMEARGELGWSAEEAKEHVSDDDRRARNRRWRDYVCESFCDTAAWVYSNALVHEEWTLAPRYRTARKRWFAESIRGSSLSI